MSELYVIGNCYAEDSKYASDLFKILTDAGYVLAYNTRNKNSATIMKEMEPDTESEETK